MEQTIRSNSLEKTPVYSTKEKAQRELFDTKKRLDIVMVELTKPTARKFTGL